MGHPVKKARADRAGMVPERGEAESKGSEAERAGSPASLGRGLLVSERMTRSDIKI